MNIHPYRLSLSLFIVISSVGSLYAQPTAPTPEQVAELKAMLADEHPMAADGETLAGFVVDPASREESRTFFRTVFTASEGVDMGWTGNYDPGDAGDTSQEFKNAVRRRINYVRAMAGVPATITFNSTFSAKSQEAALIMSGNNSLSHYPPNDWKYWTADGYEAAGKSNLAFGSAGPNSVVGYINDHGGGNTAVGHRRWLLYPQTETMGTGDVPGDGTYREANSIWVFDGNFGGSRPDTRDSSGGQPFVAWPPPGHVPYSLVFPRWSISVPGANFSGATVTMQRTDGGAPESVAVVKEPISTGVGEPTLVWVYDGLDATQTQFHPRPSGGDVTYSVSISGITVGGQAKTFNYDVTVYDPDVVGDDYEAPLTAGPANPAVGTGNAYSVDVGDLTNQFQWRAMQIPDQTLITEDAENAETNVTISKTHDYDSFMTGAGVGGSTAFRLNHNGSSQNETIALHGTFLAGSSSSLSFSSRRLAVTEDEITAAQLSFDDGASWVTVWEQSAHAQEGGYSEKSVSLAAYSEQTFQLRFLFSIGFGSWYPTGGWYVDDIELSNVSSISDIDPSGTIAGTSYLFNPDSSGRYGLQVRGVFFGDYPFDWGPVTTVNAEEGTGNESMIGGTPVDGLPGWYFSDWFGFYAPAGARWIFHAEHGFLYHAEVSTNESMYVYDHAMGAWWWTSESIYPSIYVFNPPADTAGTDIDAEWLFYFLNTKNPRSFAVLSGPDTGSFLFFNP